MGIGTLILSCLARFALRRGSILAPWRWIAPLSFALATMPRWWPEGFRLLLMLPGLGWFRAPARYTLLTSLGLVVLAGRGLDRSITPARFRAGLVAAIVIGAGSWAWSVGWARDPLFQASLGAGTLPLRFGAAALFWCLSLVAVIAWYRGRVGAWAPLAVQTAELCASSISGRPPGAGRRASPRRARSCSGSLVSRGLAWSPAGCRTCRHRSACRRPSRRWGSPRPPPNYLLESSLAPPGRLDAAQRRWQRRFGVTHGVWSEGDDIQGTEVVAVMADPALERLSGLPPGCGQAPSGRSFAIPRLSPRPGQPSVLARLTTGRPSTRHCPWKTDRVKPGSFTGTTRPRRRPRQPARSQTARPMLTSRLADINMGVPARAANVRSWDGRTAVVDHDGACYLILRRTFYDGWFYRVNDGAERPVLKVNGGLQGIPLTGTGPSDVTLIYRPTGLRAAIGISLGSTAAALCVVLLGLANNLRPSTTTTTPASSSTMTGSTTRPAARAPGSTWASTRSTAASGGGT